MASWYDQPFLLLFLFHTLLTPTSASSQSILQILPENRISDHDSPFCDSWRSVETNNAGYWSTIPHSCGGFVADYSASRRYISDSYVASGDSLSFAKKVEIAGDGLDAWDFDFDETLGRATESKMNVRMYDKGGYGIEITDLEGWGGIMEEGHNYFERGNLDTFSGRGHCLDAPICHLNLTSDGAGDHHGWDYNYLEATSTGPHIQCRQQLFTSEQWLATDTSPDEITAIREARPWVTANGKPPQLAPATRSLLPPEVTVPENLNFEWLADAGLRVAHCNFFVGSFLGFTEGGGPINP